MAKSYSSDYRLVWTVRDNAPVDMSRGIAVTHGNNVFIRSRGSRTVYQYLSIRDKWCVIPPCDNDGFGLAILENNLITIGGSNSRVGSYSWSSDHRQWTNFLSQMPTKRKLPAVTTTATHLVVAGGFQEVNQDLVTVEVMDINTHKWSTAADLPKPVRNASAAVCNGKVYICDRSSCDVFYCSEDALLQSTHDQSSEVWHVMQSPVCYSSYVCVDNKLIAVGGCDAQTMNCTSAVYMYKEESDQWFIIGNISKARFECLVAVLPALKIVVIGGTVDTSDSRIVEIGQLLSDSVDEEERHLMAFETALAEKGSLDQIIMNCLFFGYPRAGKSSLMKRLTGQPPTLFIPSSGVVEKVIQVEARRLTISTAAVRALRTKWCILTFDDEAIGLMAAAALNFSVLKTSAKLAIPHHVSTLSSAQEESIKPIDLMSDIKLPDTVHSEASDKPSNTLTVSPPVQSTSTSESSAGFYKLEAHHVEQQSPIDIFKRAIKRKGLKGVDEYLQDSMTLYLTDTGGQMEFQELLPALVAGPALFFVVFRLDHDLNKTFTIKYLHPDGRSARPYQSSFTVKETLMQSLVSIASMGTYVYSKKLRKQVPLKPKVVLVGTHKDKVSQSKIEQIECHLKQMIKLTSLYSEGIIEPASESHLMVTVNNLSRKDTNFQQIRSVVERIANRGDFWISLPSTWLIFSLIIRQQKRSVITYDECYEKAQMCGISSYEELNEVLWFLNTKVGLVRHFKGEGLEGLQDIVIVDPQILFEKITKLVVETFSFQNVTADIHDEFKRKGIFPRSVLEQMSISDDVDQLLTVDRFVKLLEHLHIIARLHTDTDEVKYFMPCTLSHAVPIEIVPQSSSWLAQFKQWISCSHCGEQAPSIEGEESTALSLVAPPLLITFKCGYCPKGLFAALSVYLLANKMQSQLKWKLQTDKIFKNSISFSVGPYDIMSLEQIPTHLKVAVFTYPHIIKTDREFPINQTCVEVRQCMDKAVQEVTSSLNYTSDAEHMYAFYCCGHHTGIYEAHPAEIQFHNNKPCSIQCVVTETRITYGLIRGHKIWFEHSPSSIYHHLKDYSCDIKPEPGPQKSSAKYGEFFPSPVSPMSYLPEVEQPNPPIYLKSCPTLKQLQHLEQGGEPIKLFGELIPYWEELSRELNFSESMIKQIKMDNQRVAERCWETLCIWLNPCSPFNHKLAMPTWESLITAMKNIDLIVLANDLEGFMKKM